MIEWVAENQDWVLSGLGAGLVLGVGGWVLSRLFKRQPKAQKQEQKGGDGAQQVQVGEARDVTVQFGEKTDNTSSQWSYSEEVATALEQADAKAVTLLEGSCSVSEVIEWLDDTEALLNSKLPREEAYGFASLTARPALDSDHDWSRKVLGERRQKLRRIIMRYLQAMRKEEGGGYDPNFPEGSPDE